jgi:uncharacterized protein (DUF305 family)
LAPSAVLADPGTGLTKQFEINFLEFAIDHHFSALRMTELAAGTDTIRNGTISPSEGTSPSPGFPATAAKADLANLKSLARRENRTQREEILTAQNLLKSWYGITYQPSIRPENRQQNAKAGNDFEKNFMEVLARHHFTIIQQASACLVSADLHHLHSDLDRYCRGIVESQLADIDELRHTLCSEFNICDYQPLTDPKGSFTDPGH